MEKGPSGHQAWSRQLQFRFVRVIFSIFLVESLVFGLAVLPAARFFEWHTTQSIKSAEIRTLVLAMSMVPAYAIFAILLMTLSALSMRLLRWRPIAPAEMPIAELGWPLCNWARYQISTHVVTFFAGGLLRATPVWTMYMRMNGARIGRRVWVNSLGVSDHCLLDFGDDVVIGAGVHLSGHTVERGVVRTAQVRIGAGSTIGVNAHVEIGADIGSNCVIGSLSMVPKFSHLEGPATYVGVPARPIEATRTPT